MLQTKQPFVGALGTGISSSSRKFYYHIEIKLNAGMTTEDQYRRAWRLLRLYHCFTYLYFLPVFILVSREMFDPDFQSRWVGLKWVALALAVPSAISMYFYLNFVCPRCSKKFFFKGIFRSLTGRNCMNCALKRGEIPNN